MANGAVLPPSHTEPFLLPSPAHTGSGHSQKRTARTRDELGRFPLITGIFPNCSTSMRRPRAAGGRSGAARAPLAAPSPCRAPPARRRRAEPRGERADRDKGSRGHPAHHPRPGGLCSRSAPRAPNAPPAPPGEGRQPGEPRGHEPAPVPPAPRSPGCAAQRGGRRRLPSG